MKKRLEKFLSQYDSVSNEETFAEWIEKENIIEKLYLTAMLEELYADTDDNKFVNLLKEIELEVVYQPEYSSTSFTPNEDYELQLHQYQMSVNSFVIIQPQNYINCTDYLHFKLAKSILHPIRVTIENNQQEQLLQLNFPPNLALFDIKLSNIPQLIPARYYWKIMTYSHQLLAMGVFFVGKGLHFR